MTALPARDPAAAPSLPPSERFLNRELSWLELDRRVLALASLESAAGTLCADGRWTRHHGSRPHLQERRLGLARQRPRAPGESEEKRGA